MTTPIILQPSCPRCAYDLSGAQAVRGEAEKGTCSECGLSFFWRDVLDPERTVPNWFIERAHSGFVRTGLGTWVRAWVAPWQFWRTLKMHFPMRAGKIAAFIALMLLLSHLACGVVPAFLLRDPFGPGAGYFLAGELVGLLLNPYWTRYVDAPPIWLWSFSIRFDTPRTVDVDRRARHLGADHHPGPDRHRPLGRRRPEHLGSLLNSPSAQAHPLAGRACRTWVTRSQRCDTTKIECWSFFSRFCE